jgi:Cu(I)/Ag(I) efflux system membrane fusion protein
MQMFILSRAKERHKRYSYQRGITAMKKLVLILLFLVILLASFFAGSWFSQREGAKGRSAGVRSLQVGEESENDTSSMPPGTVKITPEKQQAIGVQLGLVEKKSVTQNLRILGRIAADDTRIYRIFAAADGWIVDAFNNPTGSLVKKDEVLATVFIPEILTEEIGFLNWLITQGRFSQTQHSTQTVELARQQYVGNLKKLGMDDLQIEELTRTRGLVQTIPIRAPTTGFVIVRDVSPNQRFLKGNELFRITDLSRVWIVADIFENESQYLQRGKNVKVSLSHQGKTFQAKISDVLPQFDPATRTLKVRLEADNPGYVLKPDMFVDVELPINLPPVITVPADAVLDSGLKRTVFIDRRNGFFEPREVETGRRMGNRVEITRGLAPGEKIVLSGNFLIDSESRLELAAAGMVGTLSKDPVCGENVSVNKAEKEGRKSSYKGTSYYFSSDRCKEQFDNNPERYIKK